MTVGQSLGPYQVLSKLGEGGMGEVYRARDTKLNRDVAIKVLPPAVAHDADRLARFSREAQLLASLNHPNIAHIHGLEDAEGMQALVMELVEGPTLADRIRLGAIPFDEALPIAKQITEALEAAHQQGIIHRDLKPANIKVRADGTVKVLDFGLAKTLAPAGIASDIASSPTISVNATKAGVILGTVAYMAPEQARGKGVDTRVDVWAFGCVLFEMLVGKRAFGGDDLAGTIAAVMSKEPDWQRLPARARALQPLLTWCLSKDVKNRLQAIGDARIQLEQLVAGRSTGDEDAARPRASSLSVWTAALSAAVAAAIVVGLFMSRKAPDLAPAALSRFEIVSTAAPFLVSQVAERHVAVSPDGRFIVYRAAAGPAGVGLSQLIVRPLDRLEARSLPGIVNAQQPFVSPDSQWVGFFENETLKKVAIQGGPAVVICRTQGGPRGADWGDDGTIVFSTTATGVQRVSANGGEPTALTTADPTKGERNHWQPSLLPGGRGVVFTVIPTVASEQPSLAVLDLARGTQKTLVRGGSQAQYVKSGHLLYATAGSLRAARFDVDRLEVHGDPMQVVDDLSMSGGGAADYTVSATGTLVYASRARMQAPRTLVWVDRAGRESPIAAPPRLYSEPRVSPDGSRVVLTLRDQEIDLWIWDLTRETLSRLTFDPEADQRPVWTPDSRRIIFASQRAGRFALFEQSADGTGAAEQLTAGEDENYPSSIAPDLAGIVGLHPSPATAMDIFWFPLPRPGGRESPLSRAKPLSAEPLVQTAFNEVNAELSPDGRFLAYQSDESGRAEIYVRPFPRVNEWKTLVSTFGGTRPAWSRDGRELFYLDLANTLTTVPLQVSVSKFSAGAPARVFATKYAAPLNNSRTYDVSPDGKRFLMIKETASTDSGAPAGMIVVLNWLEELKSKFQGSGVP